MKKLLTLILVAGAGLHAQSQRICVGSICVPTSCQDAGSTDSYACNLSPAIANYETGMSYRFKANTINTGPASINFNSLGAITIVKVAGTISTALVDGDILAGQWVTLVYDGTNMELQASGNAVGGTIINSTTLCGNGCILNVTGNGQNHATHLKNNVATSILPITVDGGGSVITTGVKGYLQAPYDCTIVSWTILGDQSGSIVFDVWKKAFATGSLPTVANTITASAKPTVTTTFNATSSTLTGWTTSVTTGDMLGFNVDSVTSMTFVTLQLNCQI